MKKIYHLVLVKFAPAKMHRMADLVVALDKLRKLLPGFLSCTGGPYSSPEGLNLGYTHGFVMTFADPAARNLYLTHPEHEKLKQAFLPELEGVVKQLRSMFNYKGYQLIDTQQIRVRAGQGGEASGMVDNGSAGGLKTISQVKFSRALVSTDEKGRAIRIDNLKVGLKTPVPAASGFQYLDTGINTDVDVHEGQKVVVGKANMDGTDRASIIVLTAKVVE